MSMADAPPPQNERGHERSWKDKWASINSKFDTCTSECITNYRSDDKCKDSLENVIADIWNLKDWLVKDITVGVSQADINAFLDTKAFNISACGDIETAQKHSHADSPHREDTVLTWEGNHDHPSGSPVVFSVIRKYKDNPGNIDRWEDAWELVRRAINEWEKFLTEGGLL